MVFIAGTSEKSTNNQDDIDTLIQHHHQMQERLADEMLMLTRNLKENISNSGQIVREDTKVSLMLSELNSNIILKSVFHRLLLHNKILDGGGIIIAI